MNLPSRQADSPQPVLPPRWVMLTPYVRQGFNGSPPPSHKSETPCVGGSAAPASRPCLHPDPAGADAGAQGPDRPRGLTPDADRGPSLRPSAPSGQTQSWRCSVGSCVPTSGRGSGCPPTIRRCPPPILSASSVVTPHHLGGSSRHTWDFLCANASILVGISASLGPYRMCTDSGTVLKLTLR